MNEAEPSAEQLLQNGLASLHIDPCYQPQLLQYLLLLDKWNKTYNLTAIRTLPAMVTRHILDSLAITPYLHGKRILDVGSGAGLPGIALSISNPTLNIVLIDSNGKKIRFLHEVKRALQLANVDVVHSRVENYRPSFSFDTVISRAVGELKQLIAWTRHLIAADGIWLAMKGQEPHVEIAAITSPYVVQVHPYQVPGINEERCAVIISKESEYD